MKQIYFNHDGGVDDLISLFLLLQMEDVSLIGVSAIGADSYVEPAASASQKSLIALASNRFMSPLRNNAEKIHSLKIGVCMHFLWTLYLF